MADLYRNIRNLRIARGMTQEELAEKMGYKSKSTIAKIESGINDIPQSKIKAFADALSVSISDLLDIDTVPTDTRPLPSNVLPMPKMVKKPLLGTIACGTPILAVENIEENVDVPEGIQCDFVLRCKGDSMVDARIFDGDLVYLRQQEEVENGQIAAILIDDGCESEATLKRVYLEADRITLVPENRKYQPFVYVREEMDRVRIIGKAVAFTSTVR